MANDTPLQDPYGENWIEVNEQDEMPADRENKYLSQGICIFWEYQFSVTMPAKIQLPAESSLLQWDLEPDFDQELVLVGFKTGREGPLLCLLQPWEPEEPENKAGTLCHMTLSGPGNPTAAERQIPYRWTAQSTLIARLQQAPQVSLTATGPATGSYALLPLAPDAGRKAAGSFYRIRCQLEDGGRTPAAPESQALSRRFGSRKFSNITASPNPFTEFIQLKIDSREAEVYDIRVYDQVGNLQIQEQLMAAASGTRVHTLDFTKGAACLPGMYRIVVENARKTIRKVIEVMKSH